LMWAAAIAFLGESATDMIFSNIIKLTLSRNDVK
jgi:hypothetical protein